MTIKTATGKEFDADLAVENPSPPRLYLNILNSPLSEVAAVFTDPAELPVEGYPRYTAFDAMNMTPFGSVNICLK